MRDGPYTPTGMDAARGAAESRDSRFDELYAEAKSTLGYGANNLRSVTESDIARPTATLWRRWHRLRDQLDAVGPGAVAVPGPMRDAAAAAEAGAEDARQQALRSDVERLTGDLGRHQPELSKLELSVRSMENAWLFLERGDASLLAEVVGRRIWPPTSRCASSRPRRPSARAWPRKSTTGRPRRCRTRSSRSSTSSASSTTTSARPAASCASCASCSAASWATSATFISQLRPPLLDELGLDGSILDAVESMAALTGATVETDLARPRRHPDPTPADGRPADRPGGAPERAQARRREPYRRVDTARRGRTGSWRSATTAAASTPERSPREAGATSASSSCASGPSSSAPSSRFDRGRAAGTVVWLSIPAGEESA